MKQLLCVGAVVCLLMACTETGEPVDGVSAEATATVYNEVMRGGSAHLSGGDYFSGYFLDVFEGGPDRVHLMYDIHAVDPTSEVCEEYPPPPPPCDPAWDPECCEWDPAACEPCEPGNPRCEPFVFCRYTRYTYEYGWGSIPAEDFQSRPYGASLDTTVTPSARFPFPGEDGFYIEHCTVDEEAGVWDCGPGTGGGDISIRWGRTNQFSSFHSGVSQERFGKYTFRSSGVWRSSSANATGLLVGHAVDGEGDISSGLNVQKSMFVEPR